MWKIIGHEWAETLLRRHLESNGVRHAYLFTGPEGVGKRTLARRMAQAWMCAQPPAPGEPCGVCRSCQGIERDAFPDWHVLQPDSAGGAIRVEAVRELERQLALSPFEARGRVALLGSFHLATEGASNAVLKTLEEPPPKVLLLVTAPSTEDLLPTLVSRCEVIRLRPVPRPRVETALREEGASEEEARQLAAEASGRPGWAIRLLRDPARRQSRTRSLDDLRALLRNGRAERLAYAEKLVGRWKDLESYEEKRGALLEHLEPWSEALRLAMRDALGAGEPWVVDGLMPGASMEGRAAAMIRGVQAIERVVEGLRRNAHLQMAVESMLLELPYFGSE
ncbi:MAG: DNA polymerase III subunit delta' [Anaerolineales bacterium]